MKSSLNTLPFLPYSFPSPVHFSKVVIKLDLCFLFWLPLFWFVRPSFLTSIILNSLLAFLLPTLPLVIHPLSHPLVFVPHLRPTFQGFLDALWATSLRSSHMAVCPLLPLWLNLNSASPPRMPILLLIFLINEREPTYLRAFIHRAFSLDRFSPADIVMPWLPF